MASYLDVALEKPVDLRTISLHTSKAFQFMEGRTAKL
jgi:hypothetical protein